MASFPPYPVYPTDPSGCSEQALPGAHGTCAFLPFNMAFLGALWLLPWERQDEDMGFAVITGWKSTCTGRSVAPCKGSHWELVPFPAFVLHP